MTTKKMHEDEISIDEDLVRKLLADQFPDWQDLPLVLIQPTGTQNAIYQLGKEFVLRLPHIPGAVSHIEKEYAYLSRFTGKLPLSVPTPVAKGNATDYYPFPWSVYQWLEGESAVGTIRDEEKAAIDLGHFVKTLHTINPAGGHLCRRGMPLMNRDKETRAAINELSNEFDAQKLLQMWEKALALPQWDGEPVWIHGDLQPANMLTQNGNICAIVDFGSAGIGDPAVDMMPAWTVLSCKTRKVFQEIVDVDDATWLRGCGWALTFSTVIIPYYKETNIVLSEVARKTLTEVLADY